MTLTHYQTTNFRLFQTEWVCRRQFQIWGKWQKVIQTGRKHWGKRRNCLLRAIFTFSTVLSKGLFPRGIKRCHWVGKGKILLETKFNPFPNKPWFLLVCSTSLLKTLWEKEKLLVTSNFSFSHSVFYPFWGLSSIFIKLKIVVCKLFLFGRV